MALLLVNPDGTYANDCAICGLPLTDPVFATTHFIHNQADRLYPFSDAGMHWECYANWKYQRRFAKQYFEAAAQWKSKNPHWAIVAQTEDFLVCANPNLREPTADVNLCAIGPGFRVPICDWTDWVNGAWDGSCDHDLERLAMMEIEERLRQVLPDSATLLSLAKQIIESRTDK